MAPTWQAYPSRITTEVNSLPDWFIDGVESIGSPRDAAATVNNSTNSFFALLKGIAAGFAVPTGSGAGDVNTSPKVFGHLRATLGMVSDGPAPAAAGSYSAISLLKGILDLP